MRDQLWRVTKEDNLHEQMRELNDMISIRMEELMISHQEADNDQIRRFPVAGHQSRSCSDTHEQSADEAAKKNSRKPTMKGKKYQLSTLDVRRKK